MAKIKILPLETCSHGNAAQEMAPATQPCLDLKIKQSGLVRLDLKTPQKVPLKYCWQVNCMTEPM